RPPMHEYIRYLLFTVLSKATEEEVAMQLRKLPWAECEPYLIKCLLKVQKGKYNQVYLSATLTATLRKFHDSLAVHLADDLLSEIRYLLHFAGFTKQQRLLSLMKLLGELYNDLVVDAHVVFDTLYTLLSAGTERTGPLPDPPQDCFRIRVVCTLLDTCGQHFDHGALRRRLDLFLAHFQRYVMGKERVPMDVEFSIADTFEELRPDWKRAESGEVTSLPSSRRGYEEPVVGSY
ncbi:armadillo-type protein, partial [Baffinella frigidus]